MISSATLRGLVRGKLSRKDLLGPLGIGHAAMEAVRRGVVEFTYLMAIISVSLAVVNFLPVPVLDGGHFVFLLIEKIRGKPVPVKVLNAAQLVGLALILFVLVAVTWTDIARFASGLW